MKKYLLVLFAAIALFILLVSAFYLRESDAEKKQGILSLTFDDGILAQYTLAYSEMEKYDYSGTLFLLAVGDLFEGGKLMSFEQAKEMQDNGWEIGSHTLSHRSLTILSEEELKKELKTSKEILENNNFIISSIAFPFGNFNGDVIEETKKYYLTSRPMQEGYNDLNEINFYELKSKWILSKHNSEEICSWISHAQEKDLWLILIFHYVGQEKRPFDISIGEFREVLKCINDTQIQVKTIREVWDLNEKRN